MSTPTQWNEGEPPKDGREYVALGHIAWSDSGGGGTNPFTETIHWNGQMWLNGTGLVVGYGHNDRVRIHHWTLPPEADK